MKLLFFRSHPETLTNRLSALKKFTNSEDGELIIIDQTDPSRQTLQQFQQQYKEVQAIIVEFDREQCGHKRDIHSDSTTLAPPSSSASSSSSSRPSTFFQTSSRFLDFLASLSQLFSTAFLLVLTSDNLAIESASFRWDCFQKQVHMVTSSLLPAAIDCALERVDQQYRTQVAVRASIQANPSSLSLSCQFCPAIDFNEDTLHAHYPLFHANSFQRTRLTCQLCHQSQSNLMVHFHNSHGPQGRGELPSENVAPNVIHPFALCIIRRVSDGKFLMVQEFSNSGFWLPGGRAENGESLQAAAVRECLEEAGVEVELKGLLKVEYSSVESARADHPGSTRLRVIFYGEPIDQADSVPCKTVPDFESVGSAWVSVDELAHLHLRGGDPVKWFPYVHNGGPIYPLAILKGAEEGPTGPGSK